MSKLNKIITNQPVVLTEEEVNNLSETLSAVRTAGGGEGGHLYTGDNKYIGVDNGNYKIKFLDNAAEKLESISSKLDKTEAANTYLTSANAQTLYQTKEAMSDYAKKTEIPDSITDFADTSEVIYSYINPATADIQQQLNDKQPKLQFVLNDKGEISAIGPVYGTTTALAGAGGVTGDYYSASNPSGFINSTQAETQILEKHYLTKASGDLYYLPNPSELIEGTQYAYTTQGWSPIQGGGGASGISFVNHDDTLIGDGNTVKLGVDTTKIQTKLSDAEIQNITDVTTLKTASSTWDNVSAKLNTTDFNTYTGTTAPATYQAIGNYLSSNALDGYATQQWVDDQGYIKQETDWTNTIQEASAKAYNDATANANSLYQAKGDYVKNTDISLDANNKITAISGKELIITAHQSLTNYYTKSDTSSKNELSTEFGKYALKSEIPTKVSDLTDSANYYKTTDTSGKNEITNALNTKVDKPTSLQTGKLVYDGDTSAWVSLPAGTTTIVQGQGSVTANYDSQNSTYTVSLLASAENALSEVGDKIDTTAVAQTYQTKDDMTNYLTTSDAANTYQPKGNYAPETVTATINTLTAASASWNEVSAKLGTAQYANDSATFVTSSNSTITGTKQYALTTAGWAEVSTPTIPDITATSGISADGFSIGLTNTAIGAITSVSSKVDIPDTTQTELNNNYLIYSTLTGPGTTTGWLPLSANYYSKSESDGRYAKASAALTSVSANTPLSGNGTTANPLGFDLTNAYTIDGTNGITAVPNSTTNKVVVQMTNDVWTDTQVVHSSISAWNEISGLSAKSTVSANTATNVISISANSTATTANISATTYYTNTADSNLVAQRLFVVHNDDDLVAHVQAGLCQGQGSLFFVMSGFNS